MLGGGEAEPIQDLLTMLLAPQIAEKQVGARVPPHIVHHTEGRVSTLESLDDGLCTVAVVAGDWVGIDEPLHAGLG